MNFFFFGDSICFGQGVSPHKTWVTRISAEVDKRFPDRGVVVVNSSINGNTTRMALERMSFDVTSHGVLAMLVQFGLNDCNYWVSERGMPRTSERGFQSNLNEILDRANNFGAKRLLLNTNHPTPRTAKYEFLDRSYEDGNRRYNALIRAVAGSRSDVELIDVESACLSAIAEGKTSLDRLVLSDGLHLSDTGHDLYFQIVAPRVLKAVGDALTISNPLGKAE
jgi:acyl-CoA thioesterase I